MEPAELYEVFNMGCGFCCVVPAADAAAAVELLAATIPAPRWSGRSRPNAGVVELPSQGLVGRRDAGFAPA